jgi:aspartyl aminopeptidase
MRGIYAGRGGARDSGGAMIADLAAFLDASPTPWHAVADAAARLTAAGYRPIDLGGPPEPFSPGDRRFAVRDGSLVAVRLGTRPAAEVGFHLVAAHTDSPCLRVKPVPVIRGSGAVRLGVEVYGGVLLHTWTDRDLGIAGLVHLRDGATRRVELRRPLCRIPNLAIHLQRSVNDEGLKLNPAQHLPAVLGLETGGDGDPLRTLLGEAAGVGPEEVATWDLCLFDVARAAVSGAAGEFLHSGRLDNLASCHAALSGLLAGPDEHEPTAVVALFDHEEIGSVTHRGADGRLLEGLLRRIVEDGPASAGGLERALAHSFLVSADMAHGVHPNFADRHDPQHAPRINGGPVIKQNSNHRYATEGAGAARFARLCERVSAPVQWFVTRSDLACGSTVGPLVTARLGVAGVDIGSPMWSMHSIREACGTADPVWMSAALGAHLSGAR